MPAWLDELTRGATPPDGLVEWAQSQPSYEAAWAAAPRADWLVWLASRRATSEPEQRYVVARALYLADRAHSSTPNGVLRPILSDVQLAAEWASPGSGRTRYLYADIINALIVAAIAVIPVVIAVRSHFTGTLRRSLYSDLFSIPVATVVGAIAFFILQRIRRRNAQARLSTMTWERARDIAFDAMAHSRTRLSEDVLRREADLLRAHWPKRD